MLPVRTAIPVRGPTPVTWGLFGVLGLCGAAAATLPPVERAVALGELAAHGSVLLDGGAPWSDRAREAVSGVLVPFSPPLLLLELWGLWLWGQAVEDRVGSVRLAVLLAVAAPLALAAQAALAGELPVVGSVGLVACLLGLHAGLFRRARLATVGPAWRREGLQEAPSWPYLAAWVAAWVGCSLALGSSGGATPYGAMSLAAGLALGLVASPAVGSVERFAAPPARAPRVPLLVAEVAPELPSIVVPRAPPLPPLPDPAEALPTPRIDVAPITRASWTAPPEPDGWNNGSWEEPWDPQFDPGPRRPEPLRLRIAPDAN